MHASAPVHETILLSIKAPVQEPKVEAKEAVLVPELVTPIASAPVVMSINKKTKQVTQQVKPSS
jgi:hypothetical protein